MTKHLRNLLGAVRYKTLLYSNMAKAQGTLRILTDYTQPTASMLRDYQHRYGVSLPTFFKLEKEINRIYAIEAETEDYIRGANYEAEIEKSN